MFSPKTVNQTYTLLLVLVLFALINGIAIAAPNKTHNLGQLRGATTGTTITGEDINQLGQQWGANHIRWPLEWSNAGNETDLGAYSAWLNTALSKLDKVLIDSRQAGMKVVIDLHSTPGDRDAGGVNRIFTEQQYQDKFIEVWKTIALRYKGNTTVWGYDLAHEPLEPDINSNIDDWYALATQTAQKIRLIDPGSGIVVQPAPSALPEAFNNFSPINVTDITYSVHMKSPTRFTHQGIAGHGEIDTSYPGLIEGTWWDKAGLKATLQPVIDFQTTHNVPIYVGEFSAVRWAPNVSAFNYMKDNIELFEENSWDWAYHAFRGWEGWSVELPSGSTSTTPSGNPTQREALLQLWYAKNSKPKYAFSLHPDQNTQLVFDRDSMLACRLPVMVDDQSDAPTNSYDVVWLLNTTTAVMEPVQATVADEACDVLTLNEALLSHPVDASGFTLAFTTQNSSLLADNTTLRTCDLFAKYPNGQGGQLEGNFDVDWQFNETDGTWATISVVAPSSACSPDSPIIIIH